MPKKPVKKPTEYTRKDLRLPAEMFERLRELAKKNRRSMTAEIEIAVGERLEREAKR